MSESVNNIKLDSFIIWTIELCKADFNLVNKLMRGPSVNNFKWSKMCSII